MFASELKSAYCYYGLPCRWSIAGLTVNGHKRRIHAKDVQAQVGARKMCNMVRILSLIWGLPDRLVSTMV
jgi:hypothetical protein